MERKKTTLTVKLNDRQSMAAKKDETAPSKNQPAGEKKIKTGSQAGFSRPNPDSTAAANLGTLPAQTQAGSSARQPFIAQTKLASRTNQIITVVASGSIAQVKLWEKKGGSWSQTFSVSGHVGSKGIGPTREGMSTTPYGAYSLGLAFGMENPGTQLPFREITSRSWWVEDSESPYYNSWKEGSHFNSPSEHLADYPVQYRYAIVINYNTARTPYAGSGFFVHCDNGGPTAGCVSIPISQMKALMQTLRPGAYIINVHSDQEIRNF